MNVEEIDFGEGAQVQEIIAFVEEIGEQIERPQEEIFIRSEEIEDIVNESPYIWVIEINEPARLSSEQIVTDWGLNDIYYGTVVQTLKGDIDVGYKFRMIFHADTVLPGEQHIVATAPLVIEDGSTNYRFTSRNSLFSMNQLDEIMSILNDDNSSSVPSSDEESTELIVTIINISDTDEELGLMVLAESEEHGQVVFSYDHLEDIGATVGDVVKIVITNEWIETDPIQVHVETWSIAEE